jgi:hypothetical protein
MLTPIPFDAFVQEDPDAFAIKEPSSSRCAFASNADGTNLSFRRQLVGVRP